MRIDVAKAVGAVRTSYWFVPSLMAFAAILLGGAVVWLDAGPGANWLDGVGWYQRVKAEGAHEVLSTIAGSMITVAGVVFSVTIVAISYASSQYGPRVLTNFLSDRGNKVTLGTFIATFLYCLVVLRTIRGGDDSFVPQIAVLVGIFLALCSIGVLIYFIHHVPQTIHVNHVIARIGERLVADVDRRFPDFIGEEPSESRECRDRSSEAVAALTEQDERRKDVAAVRGIATGYIQSIDDDALIREARTRNLVLRLRFRPGDFLVAGRTLLDAWPIDRIDDEAEEALRSAFTTGSSRTPWGDLAFLINELVEIATRALSTGVNDPTTAKSCLDWIGAGASEVARRRLPAPVRLDEEGKVRVIAQPDGFPQFVERSFGTLRPYVARDSDTALHMLRTIGEVATSCVRMEQIRTLVDEVRRLDEGARLELRGPEADAVAARACELLDILALRPDRIDQRQADWLGGSA